MDNELIKLCNQCGFTGNKEVCAWGTVIRPWVVNRRHGRPGIELRGWSSSDRSQSEIPDVSFSPGSQDSLTNIVPFDFDATNCSDSPYLRSSDRYDGSQVESCSRDFQKAQYRLIVSFESQVAPVTKSTAWTYSELLRQLYANVGQPCPISIRLEPRPQPGFRLRCSLQYTKTAYVSKPVVQCANHSTRETDITLQGHVLRSCKYGAQYERNEHTGRYSVLFPFDIAQGDDDSSNLFVFEFKCLTTCLCRLKTKLVFEVECADKILCSQNVDVRICSCPGRDRRHDEAQLRSHDPALANVNRERKDISPCVVTRKRPSTEEEEVYTIKVRGRKNYELLEELRLKLEKADGYDERQPAAQIENFDHVYVREVISQSDPAIEQTKEPQQHSSSGGSSHSKKTAKPHHHNQAQLSQSSMTGKILKNKVSLQVPEHMK